MRLGRQLRKRLDKNDSPEEIEELKRLIHVAEVDEAYTQHHPHAEVYTSLYTTAKTDKATEDDETEDGKIAKTKAMLSTERPPIWKEIEQAMQDSPHALFKIRERRPQDGSLEKKNKSQSKPKNKTDDTTTRKPAQTTQPQQQAATAPKQGQQSKADPAARMNRRERRKQMRETGVVKPVVQAEDDDSDGGGFFEEG